MKLCWVSFKSTRLGLQHVQKSKGSNKLKGSKNKVHFLFTLLNWDFVNLLKSFRPQPICSKIIFFTTENSRTKNLVSNKRSWTDLSIYGSLNSYIWVVLEKMRFKLKVSNSEENRKIPLSGLGFVWPEVDTTAKFSPLVYLDNIWHIYKVEVHTLESLWDINQKPFVPLRKIYMLRQLA